MADVREGRYRPELDGLRAIAVALVIAFHCDLGLLPGGYVGVDVFFVLSGFLITGLLLNAASGDGISMVGFYARRARRLLPMALLVLVSISATWLLISNAVDRQPLVGDARSAALYFSNWHFAATATDYFASQNAPSPFVHFWSLSVEEQFYLAWPAIVALIFFLARNRLRRARWALAGVATVLSAGSLAALAITTHAGNGSYAYFGTDCRIYQLLFGALLAIALHGRRAPSRPRRGVTREALALLQVASLAALVVIASRQNDLGPGWRGLAAASCTVVLLWSLTLQPAGLGTKVLSIGPIVYIGQISYATYLWHWPVILLIRKFVVISPHLLLIPAFVLSLGLAALSERLIERPIRHSPALGRHNPGTVTTSVAMSLIVALLVTPTLLESTRRPAISTLPAAAGTEQGGGAAAVAPVPKKGTRTPVPATDAILSALQSHPKSGPACIHRTGLLCKANTADGPSILVVGDSHVEAFLPVFVELAKRHHVNLYTWMSYVCPWERGVLPVDATADLAGSSSCRHAQQHLYDEQLAGLKLDVTIVLNRGYDDPKYPRPLFDDGSPGQQDPGIVLANAMSRAVSTVLAHSQRLIVVEPWPSLSQSQPSCLSSAQYDEQCVMYAATGKLPEETAIETIARSNPRVSTVDLDRNVCPRFPACDPVIDGIIVRRDYDHLSLAFAQALTDVLDKKLIAASAFEGASS